MAVTQTIPNTLLSGSRTFNFTNTAQPWTNATVTIDRTVTPNGLNARTTADHLIISIDWSPDGGTTWLNIAGSTLEGGLIVTKGVTLTTDTLTVGIGQPFPTGAGFRVNTQTTGQSIRIAGTVVYS